MIVPIKSFLEHYRIWKRQLMNSFEHKTVWQDNPIILNSTILLNNVKNIANDGLNQFYEFISDVIMSIVNII